jgi:integrase
MKAREAATIPLEKHVSDFHEVLKTSDLSPIYVINTMRSLNALLHDGEIHSLASLQTDRIRGAIGRLKQRRSSVTVNHALGAVKRFIQWLHDYGRIKTLPTGLRSVRPYNVKLDRRHVRRALTQDELHRLIEAARTDPTNYKRNMSGPERAMLYELAAGTGFRRGELTQLLPGQFHLLYRNAYINLEPKQSKNKQGARQPITQELAAKLRIFLIGKDDDKPVLPVPQGVVLAMRRDMRLAGIEEKNKQGLIDFHSLRKTYITHLVMSGINVKIVQRLARHATITLTLDCYTDATDADIQAAIDKMEPPLPETKESGD